MPRTCSSSSLLLFLIAFLIAAVSLCTGQTKAVPGGFAVFSKVETTAVPTGLDLTIVCSKPVEPAFTQLNGPDRLVIDLPDTLVGNHPQSVPLTGPDVRAMRINQFQKDPPVARIVLDLIGERDYSYEPKGVSFVVHLRGAQAAAAQPSRPGVAIEGSIGFGLPQAPAKAALVTGNVLPGNAVGGNKLSPGSAITAGGDTAILRLERGGEIRICPGTTASVTPSANGRSIMTGMSEGAVELHYPLAASADTVLTPDFRILLSGPGEFHYAISADPKGNTCVRALQGNTASAVVSELMGDGTYQVKPGEQVVFRAGRLKSSDANVPMECGCPPPRQPELVASGSAAEGEVEHTRTLALPSDGSAPASANSAPPSAAAKPEVVVDAPIVFRGSDVPPEISRQVAQLGAGRDPQPAPEVAAAPPRKVKKHKFKEQKEPFPPKPAALPEPPKPAPAASKPGPPATPPPTFLGKVRNFFRSIFK